jgi:hypothetical protein
MISLSFFMITAIIEGTSKRHLGKICFRKMRWERYWNGIGTMLNRVSVTINWQCCDILGEVR